MKLKAIHAIDPLWIAVGFLMLVFAFFGFTLNFNYFIFDDAGHVYLNEAVARFQLGNLLDVWGKTRTPLITNWWQLISLIDGVSTPYWYRFFNLVLHGLNALLVFLLFKEICKIFKEEETEHWSILAALLFLFHPLAVESFVWVSSAKDLLSTILGTFAIYYYLKNEKKWIHFLFAMMLIAAGGLVKPNILSFVLLLFFLDYYLTKKITIEKLIIVLVFLSVAFVTFVKFKNQIIELPATGLFYLLSKIYTAIHAIAFYILKFFIPFPLAFNYGKSWVDVYQQAQQFKLSFIMDLSIDLALLGLLYTIRNNRKLKMLFVWGFIALLPYLGLFIFSFQNSSVVANRFAYPFLIPACIFLVMYFPRAKKFAPAFYSLLLILVPLSIHESYKWRESSVLLLESHRQNPKNLETTIALVTAYQKEYQYDKAESVAIASIDAGVYNLELYFKIFEQAAITKKALVDTSNRIDFFIQNYPLDINKFRVLLSYLLLVGEIEKAKEINLAYPQFAKLSTFSETIQKEEARYYARALSALMTTAELKHDLVVYEKTKKELSEWIESHSLIKSDYIPMGAALK